MAEISNRPERRPAVLERHIDELLSSHLTGDEAFGRALVSHVLAQCGKALDFSTLSVRRQVRHKGAPGTIDLLVTLIDDRGLQAGRLLIENKLDSSFTPDQPARYAISAQGMSADAMIAVPVICAPRDYLLNSKHLAPFAARIAYEDVASWLPDESRALIESAILRFKMPYEPDPVAEVATFHEGYVRLVGERAPNMVVKRNPNTGGARPHRSRTIYFVVSKCLPIYDFLPTHRFSHQCWDSSATSPSVKIMISGWSKHEGLLQRLAKPALYGTRIYIRSAGRSLALAIDTPQMDNTRPVTVQEAAVAQGIEAAVELRQWLLSNEQALRAWATAIASAR